jgi:UDP-4-amino-4-deoxy-L-arabinose formyltransferase / UDP-glucuronic acid dehydrogenase (UDP-4-keto-hexauronic acid decarboxylating)
MKTVVLAYHEIGCAGVEFLRQAGADIRAVFTHEDDPSESLWFCSVAERAKKLGIPVYAPEQINASPWVEKIRSLAPDILFSFYYRKLVSAEILAIPPLGCFNLHGSLLPRFRGRSPTNWAILMGETRTGVTLHRMAARADTGAIVAQREVEIGEDDDVLAVLTKQVDATRALLAEVYPLLVRGCGPALVQDESRATKFGGRRPEDGAIDWSGNAESIHNLVRAVAYPWPGAFSVLREQKCMIWKTRRYRGREFFDPAEPGTVVGESAQGVVVACGEGHVEILQAQVPPDPSVAGRELKRLLAPIPGTRFHRKRDRS